MREIKFRAWDRINKIMLQPEDIEISFLPDESMLINGYDVHEDCEFIPLQFTGLLDKNGNDIYEGDIVKATFKGAFIAPIIFNEGCFMFNTVANGGHPYILLKDWCNINYKSCEVIGNIYENSELLEGK